MPTGDVGVAVLRLGRGDSRPSAAGNAIAHAAATTHRFRSHRSHPSRLIGGRTSGHPRVWQWFRTSRLVDPLGTCAARRWRVNPVARGGHSGSDRRWVFADRQRQRAAGPVRRARSQSQLRLRRRPMWVVGRRLDSADDRRRPHSAALQRGGLPVRAGSGLGMVDVTFSWYETGSLDRERALATERGARSPRRSSNGTRRFWRAATPPAQPVRRPPRQAPGCSAGGCSSAASATAIPARMPRSC